MILLGIDTSGQEGSMALAQVDATAIASLGIMEIAGKTTAAELVPTFGRLLAGAGLQVSGPFASPLGGIVVVDGPGSFTGIRIGLSTAKALAEALEVPLYAISRIAVLSMLHPEAWVVLDAGRDEFYSGCYSKKGGSELLLARQEVLDLQYIRSVVCNCCCVGAFYPISCEEKVAASLPGVKLVPAPTALQAIEMALPNVLAGRSVDVANLDGRYVRRLAELYGQARQPRQ